MADGLIQVSMGGKGTAKVQVRVGEVGLDDRGLAKVFDRLVQTTPFLKHGAQVVVCGDVVGVDLQGSAIVDDGLFQPALGLEGVPKV